MLTVRELCYLALEPNDRVTIEATTSCGAKFKGTYREAQGCEFADKEVESYSINDDGLCINITVEEV